MKNKFYNCLYLFMLLHTSLFAKTDLTVSGHVNCEDGLGKITIGIIELLKDDLQMNCVPIDLNMRGLSDEVKEVVLNPDKTPGQVCLFCAPLWYDFAPYLYTNAVESKIKIAYSMLEGSSIPPEWVQILNEQFDAVVVPDPFLVDVYENTGVKIPVFTIPLGMSLHPYFERPKRKRPSSPFVFGSTVSCDERKNYKLLLESFIEEFGGSDEVILKLNSRQGDPQPYFDLIQSSGVKNIYFTSSILTSESYVDFLDSFDCFINIAKGEGFSFCPREALALGIPCILTNNTSQKIICESGLVRSVPSKIREPAAYFGFFGDQQVGYFLTASKEDVRKALRDVYTHYQSYLRQAAGGPQWVKQYDWQKLKRRYLNLFKPKRVFLGDKNIITDKYLMTTSAELYNKYNQFHKKKKDKQTKPHRIPRKNNGLFGGL